jgi:protein TonB
MPVEALQNAAEELGKPAVVQMGSALSAMMSSDVPGPSAGDDSRPLVLAPFVDEGQCGPTSKSWRLQLATAGSLLMHVSLLAWVLAVGEVQPGVGGQELEAIGVEIVEASALESRTPRQDSATPAAKVVAAGEPGDEAPITQVEIAATASAAATEASPPVVAAPLKSDEEPVAEAEIAAAIQVAPEPTPLVPERNPEITERPTEAAKPSEKVEVEPGEVNSLTPEQSAQAAGSVASIGMSDTQAGNAAAGASPGQLARFAMQVRASLGRKRPKHTSRRGLVQIAFVLAETGALQSATVAKSSGSSIMDEAALAAVRSTTFPSPPQGATQSQRAFVVPFEFK